MSRNVYSPSNDALLDPHCEARSSPSLDTAVGRGEAPAAAELRCSLEVTAEGDDTAAFYPTRTSPASSSLTSFDLRVMSSQDRESFQMPQQLSLSSARQPPSSHKHSVSQPRRFLMTMQQHQHQQLQLSTPNQDDIQSAQRECMQPPNFQCPPYEVTHHSVQLCGVEPILHPPSVSLLKKFRANSDDSMSISTSPSSMGSTQSKKRRMPSIILAPSQPERTSVVVERMTSACLLCRHRKIKCHPGEDPFVCATCVRRKKTCRWPEGKFHHSSAARETHRAPAIHDNNDFVEIAATDGILPPSTRRAASCKEEDAECDGKGASTTRSSGSQATMELSTRSRRAKRSRASAQSRRASRKTTLREPDHSPDTSEENEIITPTVSSSSPLFSLPPQQQLQLQHPQAHFSHGHPGIEPISGEVGFDYGLSLTSYSLYPHQYHPQFMHTPASHHSASLPPPPPPEYKLQQIQQARSEQMSINHLQLPLQSQYQQYHQQSQQAQILQQPYPTIGSSFNSAEYGTAMQDSVHIFAAQQQVLHPTLAIHRFSADYQHQQSPPTPPSSAPLQQRGSDCFSTLQKSFQHHNSLQPQHEQILSMSQPSPSIDFLPPSPLLEQRAADVVSTRPHYFLNSYSQPVQQQAALQKPQLLHRLSSPALPPTPATPMPSMQTMPEIALLLNKAESSTVSISETASDGKKSDHSDEEDGKAEESRESGSIEKQRDAIADRSVRRDIREQSPSPAAPSQTHWSCSQEPPCV